MVVPVACDFAQLQKTINDNTAAIATLRAENCGDQGDVAECLKLRAASIGAAQTAIRNAELELQTCSLLIGHWFIRAFDSSGVQRSDATGTLTVTSWDIHTIQFEGKLSLESPQGPVGYDIFAASYNPSGSEISFIQNLAQNPLETTGFSYEGHIRTDLAGQPPMVLDGVLGPRFDDGSWQAWKELPKAPPWISL